MGSTFPVQGPSFSKVVGMATLKRSTHYYISGQDKFLVDRIEVRAFSSPVVYAWFDRFVQRKMKKNKCKNHGIRPGSCSAIVHVYHSDWVLARFESGNYRSIYTAYLEDEQLALW